MVHYICAKCDDPRKLGATKLNKVLWYADTISFRVSKDHSTISGATSYLKQKFGPVPKKIQSAITQLSKEKSIYVRDVDFFGKTKREYISLTAPEEDVFNEQERQILDAAIEFVCDGHTAVSISEMTHDIVWEAAQMGEEIPVFAVLAATAGEVTKDHKSWADKLINARHSPDSSRRKAA